MQSDPCVYFVPSAARIPAITEEQGHMFREETIKLADPTQTALYACTYGTTWGNVK